MDKRAIYHPRKNRPRVYIIDDSLIFRAMLETMVGDDPAFEICGVAASADEARKDIKRVLPDIVLLDLNMPGTHGLTFLEEMSDYWHAMSVVIISGEARQGSEICDRAFDRGAAACFDKCEVIRSGRDLIDLMYDLGRHRPLDDHFVSPAITLPSVCYI
jgi:two-component system chemotaxis response regulator CheB